MKRTGLVWFIAILLVLIFWLGAALVRAENERYAMYVGLCKYDPLTLIGKCLENVQTRTAWWWHLFYALFP